MKTGLIKGVVMGVLSRCVSAVAENVLYGKGFLYRERGSALFVAEQFNDCWPQTMGT